MADQSVGHIARLPNSSLNASSFSDFYRQHGKGIMSKGAKEITFQIPQGTFFVVDGTLQLLTLCNFLITKRKKVNLEFEPVTDGGKSGLSYLKRIGFFDALDPQVKVIASETDLKMPSGLKGHSDKLIEIQKIGFTRKDKRERKTILVLIGSRLEAAFADRMDKQRIADTCSTLMSELTENIVLHSKSKIEGYAALQRFDKNHTLKVAVSDCGLGILKTVKPKLKKKYKALTDSQLILEMLNKGKISRNARGGAGLRSCARNALKFKAKVWIRLPNCSIFLQPATSPGQYNAAYCRDSLPHLPGTHISFEYQLTRTQAPA